MIQSKILISIITINKLLNSKNPLIITCSDLFNDKSYFLTHGYQFEDYFIHHFITAPWWNVFMGLDEISKKKLNEFWHEWKTELDSFNYDAFYHYLNSQGINKINIRRGHVKKFIENEIYEKNKRFYDNAFEFMKKKGIIGITNIIFGHIHEYLEVKYGNMTIITNGCWLQNKQTHFTEILIDGEYNIKKI